MAAVLSGLMAEFAARPLIALGLLVLLDVHVVQVAFGEVGVLRPTAVSGDHRGRDRQLVQGPCACVGSAGVSGRQQGTDFEGGLAGPGMQPCQRDLVGVVVFRRPAP
jgi:hypothetical protein